MSPGREFFWGGGRRWDVLVECEGSGTEEKQNIGERPVCVREPQAGRKAIRGVSVDQNCGLVKR